MECTPFEQILQITLDNVQKLLTDHRMPNQDDTLYGGSQFKHLYDNPDNANDRPDNANVDEADIPNSNAKVAYNQDKTIRPYKGDTSRPAPFYPLTMDETLDLQHLRVLDYIQLGMVPLEDLENYDAPSLFIANATDRKRIEPGDTTLNQVEEVIPLNFRLMNKEPADHALKDTNIVIAEKVLEGLKYVLNPDDYINLIFERRGYEQDTVIRNIEFVQALNLEEFLSPYEAVDYLFRITIREQRSRSKTVA